jgi:hypothetical protein
MLGLFRPLEEYVGPSILTVGGLCFVSYWIVCCLEFEHKFYNCIYVCVYIYIFIYAYFPLISTYVVKVYIPEPFKVPSFCRCHIKQKRGS